MLLLAGEVAMVATRLALGDSSLVVGVPRCSSASEVMHAEPIWSSAVRGRAPWKSGTNICGAASMSSPPRSFSIHREADPTVNPTPCFFFRPSLSPETRSRSRKLVATAKMASTEYLKASTHLLPTLKAFWPTFQTFFQTHPVLSLQSWATYYVSVDPLHTAIVICAASSTAVYVAQQITGNASQVDRIWTFAPIWYGAHFTLQPVVAAKLLASGWAREGLAGLAADPVAKLSFWGHKAVVDSSVSAQLQPRLALMLGLQLLWSARLTFNAYRRGFFKVGEEDYRWPELRKGMSRWQWELFALFFIAIAQNILLAITALPQYLILSTTISTRNKLKPSPSLRLETTDIVLAVAFLVNLSLEFLADHQQQVYQNWKRGYKASLFGMPKKRDDAGLSASSKKALTNASSEGEANLFGYTGKDAELFTEDDRKRGFVTKGLWAWSRHPNFACEQLVWWILFLFVPVTFAPSILPKASNARELFKYGHALAVNYAIISPTAMGALFAASTDFTEKMSMRKYPHYASYRSIVSPFNPIDTLLRKIYYRVAVKEEERLKVERDVWGSVSGKSQ